MSVSRGQTSLTLEDILNRVSEAQILAFYLGVYDIPTVINSPLREDKNPSFGISSPDGKKIRYRDFATGESGSLFYLLNQLWGGSFRATIEKIVKDLYHFDKAATINTISTEHKHTTTFGGSNSLDVKVRKWRPEDYEYWAEYGIPLALLEKANVFPISHYILTMKDGKRITYGADRFAYAYVENKEDNLTIKVYQPFNKGKHKWISKHDRSVLGLWNCMPPQGEVVCICSSVKDALCLIANTGIPAICLQGEAYGISETAKNVLKQRFKHVCILLDNDEPGIKDAQKLEQSTGFINIQLPQFDGGKDLSDYYKVLKNPVEFKKQIINLFKFYIYDENNHSSVI